MKTDHYIITIVIAISILIGYFAIKENDKKRELIKLQEIESNLQKQLIKEIQTSNRKYIDIALNCKCKK